MYSSINKIAHKYNIYPFLTNLHYFFNRTFIKKTNIPIISILLFILVVILNSIQYSTNDKNYLQNKIIISNKDYPNGTTNISNTLLYIYDFIGINGFINNGIVYVLFFMITYICLSLIELNIGIIPLLFLLFIGIMFQRFWNEYQDAICENSARGNIYNINNSVYCCGSFVFFMTLGFVLFITQYNIHNIFYRISILILMLCIWFGCILYDNNNNNNKILSKNQQDCKMFTWHAANFVFGICCGFVLGNKNLCV